MGYRLRIARTLPEQLLFPDGMTWNVELVISIAAEVSIVAAVAAVCHLGPSAGYALYARASKGRGRCSVMLLLRTVMLATAGVERRPLTNSLVMPILAAGGHASLTPPIIWMVIGGLVIIGGIIGLRNGMQGQNGDPFMMGVGCLGVIAGIVLIWAMIGLIMSITHGTG